MNKILFSVVFSLTTLSSDVEHHAIEAAPDRGQRDHDPHHHRDIRDASGSHPASLPGHDAVPLSVWLKVAKTSDASNASTPRAFP